MTQIPFSNGSVLLRAGRIYNNKLAKVSLSANSQVRWESRLEAAKDETKEKIDRSEGSGVGTDTAAILLARKRNAATEAPQKPSTADDSQTVRPPQVPGGKTDRANSSTFKQIQGQAQTDIGIQEQNSATVSGAIPELTDEEEAKLEDMRSAQMEIRDQLSGVLRYFAAPVRYAFAYGSGVYKQAGYGGTSKPMIDMVFAVSHPDHWHALNISQNRSHYSFMGTLGSNAVAFVQDRMGAGVYYNPFIEINGVLIKYGVVSMDTLSSDLLNWDTLYLAGRMHKPTLTLRRDPLMRISKQVNLTHAVRAALLMLPKNFTTAELFHTIASLSFSGDFRMKIGGENPNKVQNIVEAQMPLFKSRYSSVIEGLSNLEFIGQDLLQQDMGPQTRALMLRKMPNNFYDQLVKQGRKSGAKLPPGLGAEAVNSERLVSMENINEMANKAIESIVARPALTQALKGVLSSGLSKSISYMYSKNSKYRKPTA
ncbi:Mitochondrial translocator assembly and maintenance protein 41 [Coemansia spiralis]|uniref:Phosphatidate cytidylyltransferase, mitochondrial n=2 Tax=Coemansia TaxID=4863 RepID=A0A9W8KWJ0_9FUNG|nr:Mitochondrial translocator assembly and maintenance protein 41 [Coemansia umbellata]KAJ2619671.1 Mitochondrial translocator assembly and maintenance protein 41 [Coemansia sp. RSA 1358]KAJ2671820.1 Mitochondrial translocator assembly and maintenance protein 41 [Coemansia spiralis]